MVLYRTLVLYCSAVLRKERGDEKRNHSYIAWKISKHVAFKGSRQVAASFRNLLSDQLIKCSTVHQKLLKAPHFVERPNDVDYMQAIEEETGRLYALIDQSMITSKASLSSSIVSSRLGAESVIEQAPSDLAILCRDGRIHRPFRLQPTLVHHFCLIRNPMLKAKRGQGSRIS